MILESRIGGVRTAGRIVEVEAYRGPDDRAAHSAGGRRTPRNETMYGRGGLAYVYLIYGLHHCLNVVTADAEQPQAVLVRALEPIAGLEVMRRRRGGNVVDSQLARGPGNLARALGIDRRLDGHDLRRGPVRVLLPPDDLGVIRRGDLVRSPRVGIDFAGAWAARPWRYSLRAHPCVSRPKPLDKREATCRSAVRERRPGRSSPR